MKKYDNYKDSGIEWIGEIPEHWKIQRLKYAFDLGTGLSITKENLIEKGVPCVNYGEIHSKYGFEVDINKHNLKCVDVNYLNTSKKALMNQGEFIFADTSEDIEGSGNFTHIKRNGDIFAGYHTITARPIKKSNSLYFAFLFDSIDFRTQIRNSVKGIKVFSITQGILKDTFIWHPPFEEQTAIANYLDQKTTQIDTLIAKKAQFISLLQEERTAVINQAVTKGLDPKVKMKDSGIEWLGEIPEHWEVKRMKYVVKTPLKYGANESAEDEIIEDPRYIRITDFGNDGKLRKNTFKSLSPDKAENFLLEEGDILFARSGATVGKTFFFKDYKGVACFAGYLIKASCDPMIMKSEFLYEFTNSSGYENWKQSIFQQSTIQNIGADKYNQLKIGVPPIPEQQKIIDFITVKTNEIINLISKSEQEIELLREFKTALISEVVTGKINVQKIKLN